jgi:hypothetical protein
MDATCDERVWFSLWDVIGLYHTWSLLSLLAWFLVDSLGESAIQK